MSIVYADFMALFDRLFPDHWLRPLLDTGPGGEILQAFARIGERASTAVEKSDACTFVLDAPTGATATGTIYLARPTALAGQVTVKAGTIVKASASGRQFIVRGDVVFGVGVTGPLAAVVDAVAVGYEYNVAGTTLAASGTVLPTDIDAVVLPVQDPPFGDSSIYVHTTTTVAGTLGGAPAALNQLGVDRGVTRNPGEIDAQYRARVLSLPDTISPDAIRRALLMVMARFGYSAANIATRHIETFELAYQTCWDAPGNAIPGSTYNPDLFCYDDPRSYTAFNNRWLDEVEQAASFIFVMPMMGAVYDCGMAYDDTALTVADHMVASTGGQRAHNAYDVTSTALATILQGGYDGWDVGLAALNKGIWDMLQEIKGGGCAAILERDEA